MADRDELDPVLAAKWGRIAERLRTRGWQPFVIVGHRTERQQQWLHDNGRSKVVWGYHVMVNEAGAPAALALDAGDRRYEGKDEAKSAYFYRALGEEAAREGLVWGGAWSRTNPTWARYGLGWDPMHVQLLPNSELEATKARYDRIVQTLASRPGYAPPEQEGTV